MTRTTERHSSSKSHSQKTRTPSQQPPEREKSDSLLAEIYRAALVLIVPGAWFWLASLGWVETMAWLPAILALALAPVGLWQKRRRDVVAIGLAALAAGGGALFQSGPALWVGGVGTILAFVLATPFLSFVGDWISGILS